MSFWFAWHVRSLQSKALRLGEADAKEGFTTECFAKGWGGGIEEMPHHKHICHVVKACKEYIVLHSLDSYQVTFDVKMWAVDKYQHWDFMHYRDKAQTPKVNALCPFVMHTFLNSPVWTYSCVGLMCWRFFVEDYSPSCYVLRSVHVFLTNSLLGQLYNGNPAQVVFLGHVICVRSHTFNQPWFLPSRVCKPSVVEQQYIYAPFCHPVYATVCF